MCTRLGAGRPPSCEGAALRFEGLRDLSAFEHLESAGDVSWGESVHVAGRVDGETLRFEVSCRTERVQEQFERETGERLTFNAFASTAEIEQIDLAPLPELMRADARERNGWFAVSISVGDRDEPVFAEEVGAHARGVAWLQERDRWLAIKRYGPNVALVWLAGDAKRLDDRWRRLDEAMREVEGRTTAARW